MDTIDDHLYKVPQGTEDSIEDCKARILHHRYELQEARKVVEFHEKAIIRETKNLEELQKTPWDKLEPGFYQLSTDGTPFERLEYTLHKSEKGYQVFNDDFNPIAFPGLNLIINKGSYAGQRLIIKRLVPQEPAEFRTPLPFDVFDQEGE